MEETNYKQAAFDYFNETMEGKDDTVNKGIITFAVCGTMAVGALLLGGALTLIGTRNKHADLQERYMKEMLNKYTNEEGESDNV